MTRTSAALAVSTTLFALLIAGCGDNAGDAGAPGTSSSPAASAPAGSVPDTAKAGMFVVSYRSAFPKLAEGRSDAQIAELFTGTCSDITGGKSEDAVVDGIVERTGSGGTAATTEEARAIYTTAKYMC
ncbi:hypothetical protein [Nocardia farcinica]|uniref:hypothetical protein n=1 Tax=Nocardia farcinica TaxID=37329 RepID=UPI002456D4DC|nr:hypothetical protein [Nocardia farcinica]